ncbi:hypothetical protein [Capybara microvirus Cap3_SP_333]|nr:hypothetical protein [Capybara microvirus Cap3_SP_333]
METINKFLDWLRGLPIWVRAVACLLAAAAIFLISLQSCSSVRVVGNTADSRVTVRQSALDSTRITIDVLPNFNVNK